MNLDMYPRTNLRIHFGRFGVPDVVVSDNGLQFACEESKQFATQWQFSHVTTSPRYPQSNGKVENAVKTAKQSMRKAIDDKADVLPMLPVLLQTEPAAQLEAPGQLEIRKEKQARFYSRTSKKLSRCCSL